MGPSTVVFILLFAACIGGGHSAGKNFAVLIKGAKTWWNYPMGSAICHAYHTLRKAGMPAENIITMMFDDTAHNSRNPFPGKLFNSPNGSEVYHGVKIDYSGNEVTNDTFLAVLRGDQEAIVKLIGRKGKVLESGPDDNVFVYYSDHGAKGFVGMPTGNNLYATDLNRTLTEMYDNKRYAKLVFYLGACQSGSMFHNVLSPKINVYAMTATSPDVDGWMMYCDYQKLKACYAVEFECNWLGDIDFHDVSKRTIEDNFKETHKIMNGSKPYQYGDMSITSDVLAEFFGNRQKEISPLLEYPEDRPAYPKRNCEHPDDGEGVTKVPINMARLFDIEARLRNAPAGSKLRSNIKKELAAYEKLMDDTKSLFVNIARPFISGADAAEKLFDMHTDIENWGCYKDAVNTLFNMCPELDINSNGASAGMVVSLAYLCNNQDGRDVLESIKNSALESPVCQPL